MDTLETIKKRFSDRIINIKIHSDIRIYIEIDKKDLLDFAKFIFNDMDARFITATGVDNLDSMEVLYHFSIDREDVIVSLRVLLDREDPVIESLTPVVKGALNIEKEMYELLGIKFLNHPELKRFLLTEEYPEGVFPLRKDSQKGKK
ncbi:MAG TPA: NADH-quinone oxidoreductase subunit C [Candidatus Ratteibacteria bacterium]|uniref:NADH-quinone oxidoreductase subunit C 1 n=1 Tax=candidate division TA06 bacterium ADurb.Bin131 TaxID=1852827 RepID=A0A1V6C4Y9_UNCT6|nr:MAG: NADH-quinone oxidoreductase subunit C 1 [candidate division TA06 bacterium ADurb.Bin131]HON04814.1 NADH-quinone oxidoreductase subunit C [bacterium]HPC29846.1 NADH-quinone oxidoreductase subunit C [bacterium]HRS05744.1 NADH-quinone oxidoreductase subunit C [Candidatus Ratteibacteria bacterium]HRV03492.1 NADH-quinone oxidoreductase subunit C [Candidatus Ratteibacteria bacterium]